MTCIAWDGKTLAADKRADRGYGLIATTTKIHRVGQDLVGHAGSASYSRAMLAWFRAGAKPEDFPAHQRDDDKTVGFMVVSPPGAINAYDMTPYPVTYEDTMFALGTGREFALTAMHLGKSARDAVEIACRLCMNCGNGIDTLEFEPINPFGRISRVGAR